MALHQGLVQWCGLLPETHRLLGGDCPVLPHTGRLPKSSFKCSGIQAYNWLRHFGRPNVLFFAHQYSHCEACKCFCKHSVLFSLYLMSLRTAICPLTLGTNFTSFKHRKLHQYKKRGVFLLLTPLAPRSACSQAWKHLNFSVKWMPIFFS